VAVGTARCVSIFGAKRFENGYQRKDELEMIVKEKDM
jgi:hypothetical protein